MEKLRHDRLVSGQGQVAGYCECDNEPSVFLNAGIS